MLAIPQLITDAAKRIRNAIYGEEVQESLARGLEVGGEIADESNQRSKELGKQFQELLDTTTDEDYNSAPEIRAARNGKNNLKQRLDEEHQQVNAQLAQNMLNDQQLRAYVDLLQQQVTSMGDISPEPYSTYAELVNADPNHTGVYVVEEDGNWYYWNSYGNLWDVGGKFQSSGIADGSVSIEKTDFISISTNLIYNDVLLNGYSIDKTSGQLVPNPSYKTTPPIFLEPGQPLYSEGVTAIAFFDKSNGTFISRGDLNPSGQYFTNVANGGAVRLHYPIANEKLYKIQLNKGTVKLPYEKGEIPKLKSVTVGDSVISRKKLTPLVSGFNNFKTKIVKNPNGQVTSVETEDNGVVVNSVKLIYDDSGKLLSVTETEDNRDVVTTFNYDSEGVLIGTNNNVGVEY